MRVNVACLGVWYGLAVHGDPANQLCLSGLTLVHPQNVNYLPG